MYGSLKMYPKGRDNLVTRVSDQELNERVERVLTNCASSFRNEDEKGEIAADLAEIYLMQQQLQRLFECKKERLAKCGVEAVMIPKTEEFLFETMEDGNRTVFVPTPELYNLAQEIVTESECTDVV